MIAGRNTTTKARKRQRHARPSLLSWAFLALALIAAVGVWLLWPHDDQSPDQGPKNAKRAMIKEVVPQVGDMKKETTTSASSPKKSREVPILGTTPTGEKYVAVEASTNSTGVVESLYTLPDGSKKRVVMLQSKDTMVFDNDFDLMLGLIGTTPLDQRLPPLPDLGNMEDQFAKAIQSPIIIRDTDTEEAKLMKEAALKLRVEISDLMREGYTITQILSEHQTLREVNIKERHAFQAELNEIYRSGDVEGARNYLEAANEKLEGFGIIPLTMPGEGARRRR